MRHLDTKFCSGFGQYHTDNPAASRRAPYVPITWREILGMAKAPPRVEKSDARWVMFHNDISPIARVAEHLRHSAHFFALWLDIDSGNPSRELMKHFADGLRAEYLLYTSKSATHEKLKWRLIFLLASPVSAEDFSLLQQSLNDLSTEKNLTPDRANENTNQLCSLPNRGEYYEYVHSDDYGPLEWKNSDLASRADKLRAGQRQAEKERAERIAHSRLKAKARMAAGIESPVEAFNAEYPIELLLERYGYTRRGARWLSPLSESGNPGVSIKGDRWVSSHSSDMAEIGRNNGDAFDLFVFYEHGGDYSRAVRAAGEMFGLSKDAGRAEYDYDGVTFVSNVVFDDNPNESSAGVVQAETKVPPQKNPFSAFLDVAGMYDTDPPAREFLIQEYLPASIPFIISGQGGGGKSYFALQAAIALATGTPFMGMEIRVPTRVLAVFAEDDDRELHRRVRSVLEGLATSEIEIDLALLAQNLFLTSAVGEYIRLIEVTVRGAVSQTVNVQHLINAIQENNIGCAILDPLRTLSDGNENDNSVQNRFIEAIEFVRNATGVAVGLVHHASKLDSAGARGASAFRDGVRLVISIENSESGDAVATVRKSNYTASGDGTAFTMERQITTWGMYLSRRDGPPRVRQRNTAENLAFDILAGRDKMQVEEFRSEFAERYKGTPDAKKKALYRLLHRSKFLTTDGSLVIAKNEPEADAPSPRDNLKRLFSGDNSPKKNDPGQELNCPPRGGRGQFNGGQIVPDELGAERDFSVGDKEDNFTSVKLSPKTVEGTTGTNAVKLCPLVPVLGSGKKYCAYQGGQPGVFSTGSVCEPRDDIFIARDDAAVLAGHESWRELLRATGGRLPAGIEIREINA